MQMDEHSPHPDVVIGVGNPLMGDDGFGIVAIALVRERWRDSPSLVLVDGGTWGMNLLPVIEGARRLLIIDAIDRGLPPGSRIELDRAEIPRYLGLTLSPHQLDLREVLALAELRGTLPAETFAIGVQPERVELSLDLSHSVAAKLHGVVADIEDQLRRWGHQPVEARAVHA
jgi:hydrogenase maturation protease